MKIRNKYFESHDGTIDEPLVLGSPGRVYQRSRFSSEMGYCTSLPDLAGPLAMLFFIISCALDSWSVADVSDE